MVMDRQYTGKVPFKPHNKSKSFVCGICIAHRRWPEVTTPNEERFDLRRWRKSKNLTQKQVAKMLQTKREAISMVERGHRLMPKSWKSKLLQKGTRKKLRIHPSYNVTRGYLDLKWVKM
jgi:DNA-binding XRE family transcriptional regulator